MRHNEKTYTSIKFNYFFSIILFCNVALAQQDFPFKKIIDSTISLYKQKKHKEAILILSSYLKKHHTTASEENKINEQLYRNTYWINKEQSILYLHKSLKLYYFLTDKEKANLNFSLSKIHKSLKKHPDSVIFHAFKSLKYYEKHSQKYYAEKSNLYNSLSMSYCDLGNKKLYLKYLKKNLVNCKNGNYTKGLLETYNNLGTYYSNKKNTDSSLFYYRKASKINTNHPTKGAVYQNIGAIYLGHLKSNDSAKYYFNKALEYPLSFNSKSSLYFNKAVLENSNGNLKKTLFFYKKANDYAKKANSLENQFYIAEDLSNIYDSLKNYKQAFKYHKLFKTLNDSLKELNIIKNTNELEKKYDIDKKKKQIFKEKEKNKRNKIIAISLACLLFLFLISAIAIHKSTKRKQLLAEQEKELKEQRLQTVLKKQELTAINAMIEGQEKERKRIANDLHDDLGSLMATIKIHFNNLENNNCPKLFKKVTILLDDAYTKIRQIAHSKNSGVIGKEGLLKSVKEMAIKMSSNDLSIEVTDFGLEDRLENSLEITIFRITQELLTNIVRHANAKNAEIHLIQYDNLINLIVEDDGKGFKHQDILNKQYGMGIVSIYERIENLQGTVTIDSTINKGTSVIIDIPI